MKSIEYEAIPRCMNHRPEDEVGKTVVLDYVKDVRLGGVNVGLIERRKDIGTDDKGKVRKFTGYSFKAAHYKNNPLSVCDGLNANLLKDLKEGILVRLNSPDNYKQHGVFLSRRVYEG